MIHTINWSSEAEGAILRAMFEARKRVFVDLLKWDIPVLAGTWELDHFDDTDATYIIIADPDGGHRASARLLKTTGSHILGDLFPELVDGDVPRDSRTLEITRFCLDRSLCAADRRRARDQLVSALTEYALENGVDRYTGVAEPGWFQQIEQFGWHCIALGTPKRVGNSVLMALMIDIDRDTPGRLAANGIWSRGSDDFDLPSRRPAGEVTI